MQKIQKHIEIVSSTNAALSSMGRESREAARAVLSKHYTKVGVTIVNDLADLERLVRLRPDLVFLGMKFVPTNPAMGFHDPNKIWITEYLDKHGIAYTGSSKDALELEVNKPLAKQRALEAGLKTAPFYVARRTGILAKEKLNLQYPLFVKPTDRGGGEGIDSFSVVNNFEQLIAKVEHISKYVHSDSLIEEYLPGREISVAILENDYTDSYSVMEIERIIPADENGISILSPDVKHADAGLSVKVTDKFVHDNVRELALNVFRAIGARNYGRIDTRMDKFGVPHFLEANLMPSLIEGYGNFPKACVLNMGIDYETMLLRIVALGMKRTQAESEELVSLLPVVVPA